MAELIGALQLNISRSEASLTFKLVASSLMQRCSLVMLLPNVGVVFTSMVFRSISKEWSSSE